METIKQYRVIHLGSFTKISTIFDSEDKQAEQSSDFQIEDATEKFNQPDPLGRGALHPEVWHIPQPWTPAEYTLLGVQVHKQVAKQREDRALRREIGSFT